MNVNVNCSEYKKNSQRDTHVLKVLTIQRKEQNANLCKNTNKQLE